MLEHPVSILWYAVTMKQRDNPSGAGNQQERSFLSPDFLAGLIVGEGSYYIGMARSRGHIYLAPGFSIRMNDVEAIDRMGESLAHFGQPFYRNPAVYHRCHTISVTGAPKMRQHLDFFLPLLAGNKLRAAEVVSEFVDRRIEQKSREYTEEDVVLVERLRAINGPSGPRLPIEILRDYTLRPSERGKHLAALAR